MTDALAKEPFVALFAALNVELPLRLHDEDVGVVLDADKQDVFVVDVNAVRANEHATNIAHLIVETVNTAGGFPSASPLARASIAGQDPAAVQNPKPPARTAAGAHTPGPWIVDGPPHSQIVWADALNRVCFLAHSDGRDVERDIANARLIAAAPDLLAALNVLLPEVDAEIEQRQHGGNDEDWQHLKALSDAGHAAIAKVEGR